MEVIKAKIMHFFAPDMPKALHMIKQKLGDDAFIFSKKEVNGGIEVEAGYYISEPQPVYQSKNNQIASDSFIENVRKEMSELKQLIRNQNDKGSTLPHNHSSKVNLIKVMVELGFNAKFIKKILNTLPAKNTFKSNHKLLIQEIVNKIPKANIQMFDEGIHAFVGATGVGKTTTIAKLAAQAILCDRNTQLALITMDTFRVAACEQLRVYASILNVPLAIVRDENEFEKALFDFKDKSLVFIDTAGTGSNDESFTEKLKMLANCNEPVFHHLVMAANSQQTVLQEVIKSFAMLTINSSILTKLDENSCCGPTLTTVIDNATCVSYLCDGQTVPGHIKQASKANLKNWIQQQSSVQHELIKQQDKYETVF